MNRRSFLRNIILLSGGLMAGCSPLLKGRGRQGKIAGRVTAKGKGIGGVVISDGFQVVRTNSRGKYEIFLSPKSQFLFVSTPAGYEFAHQEYVSKHYKLIEESGKEINFELSKLTLPDEDHQFIIWADPQVKNKSDVRKMMEQAVPDVKNLLANSGLQMPVHGITVGDIVWDTPKLYKDYDKAVQLMGIPFFQVQGNHDMDLNMGGDETSDVTFKKNYGPTWFSFNRGKAHYVVLDNVYYLGQDKKYKGFIREDQLAWLKKDLQFVPKDTLLIISGHIPFNKGVENMADLLEIVEGYDVHFMTGHTHTNYNIIEENYYEHVHGTVCGAWWTGPVCGDGTPPGYGVYTVKGNKLSWQYKSMDRPLDYQLSLQSHTNEEGKKELVANVWNWDKDWKVEWWQNDQYQGQLQNGVGFDPQTVTLYKGPELPDPRPFVEPKKTDHLFTIPIDSSNARVRVKATDRFGQTYESQIQI